MQSLTIAVLCWNQRPYLRQCIAALADQTDDGFEILFLDNGSDDGSAEEAERLLAEYDLRFRVIRSGVSQGIAANLNQLLGHCETALFAPLAADDWYAPEYVEQMRRFSTQQSDAGWYSCLGWLEFEDSGASVPVESSSLALHKPVAEAIIDGDEPFFFVGCCYRREALGAVGGWDETLPIEDRDLFLRLAKIHSHAACPQRLVHYRRHSASASANQMFMIDGFEAFYAKHAADFGDHLRASRASMYQRAAAVLVDQGRFAEAIRAISRSLALKPFRRDSWRTAGYLLRRAIIR